jgi:hypothetical protein
LPRCGHRFEHTGDGAETPDPVKPGSDEARTWLGDHAEKAAHQVESSAKKGCELSATIVIAPNRSHVNSPSPPTHAASVPRPRNSVFSVMSSPYARSTTSPNRVRMRVISK